MLEQSHVKLPPAMLPGAGNLAEKEIRRIELRDDRATRARRGGTLHE